MLLTFLPQKVERSTILSLCLIAATLIRNTFHQFVADKCRLHTTVTRQSDVPKLDNVHSNSVLTQPLFLTKSFCTNNDDGGV